jgi:hypothetical protein
MERLVISAKNLAAFNVEEACPRCLWVNLHAKRLPYQIFPGIFSSIDAYNKRIIDGYFARERRLPEWLSALGEVDNYVDPPSYQRFSVYDEANKITLRGAADGIFRMKDGSHTIVDYKTAKYTPGQEALLPIYVAQLNGYAYIGDRLELHPVSQLALIYMEPVTDASTAASPDVVNGDGFAMNLSATIVPVKLDPERIIANLLARARATYDVVEPPNPARSCKDYEAIEAIHNLFW